MKNKIMIKLQKNRAKKLAGDIKPHIKKSDRILDYGCGDGLVAETLANNGSDLTLIDVIDANMSKLKSTAYNGRIIPFPDKHFDTSLALYVLHHTDDPKKALLELKRVTKNRIVISEDICRHKLERPMLEFADSFNKLIDRDMSLTFNFKTEKDWVKLFDSIGLEVEKIHKLHPNPRTPISHKCFVLNVK